MVPFVLGLSACQTILDDASPSVDFWNSAPLPRVSNSQSRPDRTNGAPLLANANGGASTFIEGSGRFVGDPPTELR